jgi:TM2 domain-containing membrane protein YozV
MSAGTIGDPSQHQDVSHPQAGHPVPHHVHAHSVALAVVASVFLPGLGSMMNGRVGKGVLIFLCVSFGPMIFLYSGHGLPFVVVMLVTRVWALVAAAKDARKWNSAAGVVVR